MIPFCALDAIWIASEQARLLRDDIVEAFDRARLTRKDVADSMRITEQELCDELALRKPMNVWRLSDLPMRFWCEFVVVRGRRTGQAVLEDCRLSRVVEFVEHLIPTRKPMAGMAMPDDKKRSA